MFGGHIVKLAEADAMFARTCAAKPQGAVDHAFGQAFHSGSFRGAMLIEQKLWQRVQTLLGQKVYKQHQMTYASDLIECGHCGSHVTGGEFDWVLSRIEQDEAYVG